MTTSIMEDYLGPPEEPKPRYWIGTPPKTCDICDGEITSVFVDGRTRMGPWANMCPHCHERLGVGVGTGYGQVYRRNADMRWIKIAG